jgi:phosphotransferase family enzyme
VLPTDALFLLPAPRRTIFDRIRVAGAPREVADSVAAAGLAIEVDTTSASRTPTDCLLLFQSAATPLRSAVEDLVPGGVLYWEVGSQSRRRPSLRDVEKQLHQLGLSLIHAYWAPLDFRHTPVLLPLYRPAAMLWYLSAMHGVRLPPASGEVLRGLLYAARPRMVITAVRRPEASVSNAVLARTRVGNSRQRLVALVGGADAYGRVALLPFSPRSKRPDAVVKVARLPARNASIAHEQAVLLTYSARLRGATRCTVPRALGLSSWGKLLIGAETCAPGRLLSADPRRQVLPPAVRDLRLVLDWLIDFQLQTRSSAWDQDRCADLVERPIEEFRNAFGEAWREAELFARVRQLARSAKAGELPLVGQHWGLTDRNIYDDHGRISVIDWEGGGPGLPMLDLVYFAWHWYRGSRAPADAGAQREAFVRLFLAQQHVDARAAAVREAIAQYVTALGMTPRLGGILVTTTWITRALGRRDRANLSGASTGRRRNNVYAEFVAVLAQHQEMLFADATR